MDLTPPDNIDLHASKQGQLYAAYSVTFGLALLSVALRLFCRLRLSAAGLWWDDYMSCAAVAVATGNFVDMILWVVRGVGTHIYLRGLPGVSHFFINLFVCEILYTLALCLNKYSILLFYWRLFKTHTTIAIPIYVLAAIVTAWGLGVIFTTVFQCIPLEGLWNYSVPSRCGVNINEFFIGNAVPNIITDWALLLLPLPYVWKLQRSTIQKVALCATFALGGFTCVISIVRWIVLLEAYKTPSNDVTWVFIGPSTWTAVETNIGIVSACLPSLLPLLRTVSRKAAFKPSEAYSSPSVGIYSGRSRATAKSEGLASDDIPLNAIDVTTEMRVETSPRP